MAHSILNYVYLKEWKEPTTLAVINLIRRMPQVQKFTVNTSR